MKKTALITGATKGIGLETSIYLAKLKWNVIGIARDFKKDFPGTLIKCDLSNRDQTQLILEEIKEKYDSQMQ
ncbi:hypothetical protein fh0823_05310 [Francisella halioticida]|uniref:SDR family NAD(P)-dependent oxidoreductase n=1 Tax=Francisella halioticida TaxID=549298 RepID=UPI001AF1AD7B|nr:SDR family NAD(P)-dependent oxidoreductase [Francisella halioticida]BCD90392.1 hypothetical protein fh0823_05310 [Francisella halioticida]